MDELGTEITFNPRTLVEATHASIVKAGSEDHLSALACPSVDQCTAIGGSSVSTFNPASPATQTIETIDNAKDLVGVACPAVSQCTVVDASGLVASLDPSSSGPIPSNVVSEGYKSAVWYGNTLDSISCLSPSACLALARSDDVIEGAPGDVSWTTVFISESDNRKATPPGTLAPELLGGIACVPDAECVVTDDSGDESLGVPEGKPHVPVNEYGGPDSLGAEHPHQGETRSATIGGWTNSPTSYSYMWEDCDSRGVACTAIAGADESKYVLTASDLGHRLRVRESAVNAEGSGSAVGPATTNPVVAAVPEPGETRTSSDILALSASLSPDRYNTRTNLAFTLRFATVRGLASPPLTGFELRLPAGLHYQAIEPPLAVCERHIVESPGVQSSGCPPSSRVGTGMMYWEVPFGDGRGEELPTIELFSGPPAEGHMGLLAYVNGRAPVYAQLLFSGELTTTSSTSGGQLAFGVPLIPSVPGGPDISTEELTMTLDTGKLTYLQRIHGKQLRVPRRGGFTISQRCRKGDFRFSATATFKGGSSARAGISVPCPKRQRRRALSRKRRRSGPSHI